MQRAVSLTVINESGFEEAVAAAQKSDVVVVCMGEMKKWSGENATRSYHCFARHSGTIN